MNKFRGNFPIFRDLAILTRISRSCKTAAAPEDTALAELVDDDDSKEAKREFYESRRNKSRLSAAHRNILHNRRPYTQSQSWVHETLKYKRGLFGKYGLESGVDPRICFPTAQETAEKEEYNRVAYPFTIAEMREKIHAEHVEKEDKIRKREEDVALKLSKLEKWSKEFRDRVAKAEAEAFAAKEKKERLVEEVRRHFGFKLDARDERFKELLAQKEKEDKKKQKEIRKKAREEKVIAKLLGKSTEGKSPAETKV
uniref:Large ribosomal subunit protein mL64 n=1 Tax=Nyssomyia neivai TaxID=330878 RepID=A0A1L8DL07_9DIPT